MPKLPLSLAAAGLAMCVAAAAAQQVETRSVWEGRWRSEARHYVEGGATPRQLRHEGSLEARFDFCVGEDGAIGGSGIAKVKRRQAPAVERSFDEGDSRCEEVFEPSEAEVPVKVTGQRQGDEFWLRLETGPVEIRQTGLCTIPGAAPQSWSNSFSAPAVWFVLFAGSSTNPVLSGLKIAAEDGAEQDVDGFDAYADSDAPTRGLVEHRNRLQIRRPRDLAHDLPVVVGNVFEEDYANISPQGEKVLETVLPRLKCQPQGSSITVVSWSGPKSDDLFLEALGRARLDHLKEWFRRNGVDPSSIGWRWRTGQADEVVVSFGR